jgi:HPt (histidine-containing phosphotransfer) domain-containing protein
VPAAILIVCALALAASVLVPLLIYRATTKRFRNDLAALAQKLELATEMPARLLEVREFHQQMTELVQAVLDEARNRKDRRLLEQGLRMRERLEVLKARVLDRTARTLREDEEDKSRKARK